MIAGFRDLVPQLRPTGTLDFDIMPMPTVDSAATVGDLTGVCIAKGTPNASEAADFLVDFISNESVATVARAGYLAPANTTVALSDDFLQKGRAPVHSAVSNNSIKSMRIFPLINNPAALEAAVADPLKALMEVQVPDLDVLTAQVDAASQTVLAPPETASPSPEGSDSG
jgi:multiple sugar transport system substrate-binding protein